MVTMGENILIKLRSSFVCILIVGSVFSCNNTANGKLKNKEKSADTVLTFKIVKSEEVQCKEWKEPSKSEILLILYSLHEVTGRVWNDCYGDWTCGIEGELIFKGGKCYYRLDAGGWIILKNGDKQRYFVCKEKSCWKHFPSESFCDKDGNIIDSP
jgi:hypothetical protein